MFNQKDGAIFTIRSPEERVGENDPIAQRRTNRHLLEMFLVIIAAGISPYVTLIPLAIISTASLVDIGIGFTK